MSRLPQDISGILVDTSVARKQRMWDRLCELARECGMRVYISTITYGEMLHFLRRQKSDAFASEVVDGALEDRGIRMLAVDETVAETFAAQIHARHPTPDDWGRAKQAHCLSMLGLRDEHPIEHISLNRRCSCTSDWFIAATAAAHDLLMVTDDTGPEFDICETWNAEEAIRSLQDGLEQRDAGDE